VLQFGGEHVRTITEPNIYFKYPLVQTVRRFDKRILFSEARPAEYITLDKKRLIVDTISRWRITDPYRFLRTFGDKQGAMLRLNDLTAARLREGIANHEFQTFITADRKKIMDSVTKKTADEVEKFGIEVIDVRVKRVDLPEEVQASVFARMKAERERIAKRYRAEGEEQAREIRAKAEKEKEIIRAEAYGKSQVLRGEGDGEAAAIYAAAYNRDAEFYSFLRHLEVYKSVLGTDSTVLLRPDSALLRYLNGPEGRSLPAKPAEPASKAR
jgi:modulator of FtsH protease HflC